MSKEKTVRKPLLGARPYGEAGAVNQFGPHYELPRAWSRHQSHWYCGPPPLVYKNLSVIQWSREDSTSPGCHHQSILFAFGGQPGVAPHENAGRGLKLWAFYRGDCGSCFLRCN
jgi:hypothetical protein